MSETAERRDRLALALWILGLVVFIHARVSNHTVGIDNPDIGGITYNADLLLAGKLPYVDSYEYKAPGCFFLFAAVFGVVRSLDALQGVFAVWMLAGVLPLVWGARRLYGPDRRREAVVGCLYLLSAGQFDFNYSSWMAPVYGAAGVLTLVSLRSGRQRDATLAGVAMMAAYLLKKQAAVLAPFGLLAWFLGRRWGWEGARLRTLLLYGAGALAMLVPFSLPYLFAGELPTFLAGVFPFGHTGAYVTSMAQVAPGEQPGLLLRAGFVTKQLLVTFPAASLAALVGCVALTAHADEEERRLGWVLALFVLWSWVAGGLGGGRFYAHYAIQYLPALCLLGVHPVLTRSIAGRPPLIRAARTLVLVALAWQLVEVARGKADRYNGVKVRLLPDGRSAPAVAGEFIAQRTAPTDTIMVWGWTAWPTYFWAQRLAPTRVYKSLGFLTTFNSNTGFSAGGATPFRPGPMADEVLAAFEGPTPPKFFVVSPSFVSTFGNERDPLESFEALGDVLRRDYRPVTQFGDLVLLERQP